ncbi:tetratricopeptide repeat protein 19 homolog, mitochondrial [Microplitis mediator]|uniref:tetratricopeptide repeat protein 19 homolog, mitochondrial n=1 Tax=Microplitis mediator TaxID=375433 RepID=UPI0025540606|nr:tetratricopeptide repeat protein 19 homolog, mitochondrial [Microplitis mediator]
MSMRFLRATSLFRRVVHFDNLKQTTSRFKSLSLRTNQEKFKFRRSKWNYVIGGVGLFGFNFGSKDDEEVEPELIMTIKRSILLIQKEEYKKAEQMLHVALRQAQTINHYEGVTYVYDVMANLAFQVGEIQKSIDLFKTVMQRLLSTGTEENDTKIIHISLKVANLYQRAGDNKTAEEGYKFCIEKIEEHAIKNPTDEDILVLWAMSRDWYANMLLSESRLSEALENYQKSYQLCTEIYGKNHEQTVILLNDLGTVCCLLGQHDRALGYLSDAIETGTKLPDCPELSSIYVNLGNVYIKKSLYNEAKVACFEGLKRAKKYEDQECRDQANLCLAEVKKCLNR